MDSAAANTPPRDYLGLAILSIFCGVWPLGIVATVYASRTSGLNAAGQNDLAAISSRKALRWMIASFVTLPALLVVLVAYALIKRAMI